MKQSFLSVLENKYYYAVSRYFWHLVIALGLLGIGAGILVYVWTLVPPSKREVIKQMTPAKPAYPDLKNVALKEIMAALPKKKSHNAQAEALRKINEMTDDVGSETYQEEQATALIDSAALATFNKALGQTKALIPVAYNPDFWSDRYETYFNSPRDKKMYHKTHDPNLRHSRLVSSGFKTRFINFTRRNKLTSYYDKATLLQIYNRTLEKFDIDQRKKFINQIGLLLPVKSLGSRQIEKRLTAIGLLLDQVAADQQIKFFGTLWDFIRNNPNDGIPLLQYLAKHIDKVPYLIRIDFIKKVLNEYTGHYNNNLYGLEEATNHFYSDIAKIPTSDVPEALKVYYKIYRKNNRKRTLKIAKIDHDYNRKLAGINRKYQIELAQAQADYNRAYYKKQSWRAWSYKGIFAGFFTLLLISLILLILSMIRNVNRLTEAMYEQNHNFQNQLNRVLTSQKEQPTKNTPNDKTENISKVDDNQ